jgi:glycosyltransferase involved in cell wall biosynthesis
MRIAVFAYACEPKEGSEPGVGWMWARMLATLGDVWVVTRANNREAIEAGRMDVPERDRLHFLYVDLPPWARFWKRGSRGLHLYYLMWQVAAWRELRRFKIREGPFDIAWHVTLATVWLGSLAPLIASTFVFGPVGGGVNPPRRLLPSLGMKGVLYEAARVLVRSIGRLANPFARLAWRRADLILVQNPEAKRSIPKRHRGKCLVFPNVVVEEAQTRGRRASREDKTALFAARLLPWKGGSLAIRAIAEAPGWRLIVCGAGPDEARLRKIAHRYGVSDLVEFRGWRPREEVLRLMTSDVQAFLLPSLHDEAGWAVVEAMSAGCPVVGLKVGGPAVLLGERAVPVAGRVSATVTALASALDGTRHETPDEWLGVAAAYRLRERAAELSAILVHSLPGVLEMAGPGFESHTTRSPSLDGSESGGVPTGRQGSRREYPA